ncbi:MAG: hypothetical protein R2834_10480 [Rhodothermales bacterium]
MKSRLTTRFPRSLRSSLFALALTGLISTATVTRAQAQNADVFVTVCTMDAETSSPLEQSFVLARYQTQPSATAFTDATGCARLAVPTRIGTGTEDDAAFPSGFAVDTPFPHPVLGRTALPFRIDTPQQVHFALYDILGRAAMPDITETLPAGAHEIALDMSGLQAGLYLYRFTGEHGAVSGQLIKVGGGAGVPASARIQGGEAPLARGSAAPASRSAQSVIGVRIEAQRDGYLTMVQERDITDGERVDLPLSAVSSGVPPSPILTAPADGATEVSASTLALVWQTVASATSYTAQLSTAADFSTVALQVENIATPAFTLTDLALGTTYYWRIRATTDGVTGNWSATFHFATEADPSPVPTPVLLTPSNGSTNLPTEAVAMSWTAIEGATGYDIQLALTSTFDVIDRQSVGSVSNAFVTSDLAAGTTYYWRVRGHIGLDVGDWTTPFSFATAADAVSLTAPEPTTPANGASNIPIEGAALGWTAVTGATNYAIQVSTQADFSSVEIQAAEVPETGYLLPALEPGTTYYWRAQASDGTILSAWSIAFSFTTETPAGLTPPALTSPANGETNTPFDVNLQWSAVDGATSYQLQVATNADFAAPSIDQSGLTQTAYTVDNLDAGTQHFWRVRASDGAMTSAWSTPFAFTTQGSASLAPPELSAPANGASGIDAANAVLMWSAAAGATGYHVQVSTLPSFATQVVDQEGVPGTSLALPALNDATTYYWRARTEDGGTYSDWSAAFSFTTAGSATLMPPALSAPQNGATGISLAAVALTWQSEASASTYHAQVSTSSTFNSVAYEQSGLAGTSYTINGLVASTTYYWRVQSENGGASSEWSEVFSFTTDAGGTSNEMIALDLMGPNDTYYGLKGGLVDNGVPTVTATNGKIVIVAISMSNGLQEFDRFISLYEGHQDVSTQIELVNCAVAGSALENWLSEQTLWSKCKDNIEKKYSLDQVKVIWAKNADQFTADGITLPSPDADYYDLTNNIGALAQKIGDEFPSVQAIFNTSRIYGGYVVEEKQGARGEPISYEGGFATNAAIERWKNGELPGAPWMGWGPYLWANGLTPNGSGIFWDKTDFQGANGENQHPSEQGATKVADALHDFFMQFAWYRK